MKNKQKGFIGIAIAVIITLILGGGVMYYYNKSKEVKKEAETQENVSQDNSENTNTSNFATSDWKNYTDTNLQISFIYPSNWKILSNDWTRMDGTKDHVGVTLTPSSSNSNIPSENQRIDIGGAQIDCESLTKSSPDVICRTVVDGLPVYTESNDPKILEVFNKVYPSIAKFSVNTSE